MKVRELQEKLKDLPQDASIFVAEVDEAFAADIVAIDVVENARTGIQNDDRPEAVELAEGNERVVVIRW
ncbi:hypothetical protein [Chelativorans sp. J32]|uniref:hypothetical protein n=1 Tax=Chelativorans sp. J32 TaxID=935840 RepID=UPI0004821E30|nr:hypothetical protein [Chelativorans sp. J32]